MDRHLAGVPRALLSLSTWSEFTRAREDERLAQAVYARAMRVLAHVHERERRALALEHILLDRGDGVRETRAFVEEIAYVTLVMADVIRAARARMLRTVR
jgi:hypothetical protein